MKNDLMELQNDVFKTLFAKPKQKRKMPLIKQYTYKNETYKFNNEGFWKVGKKAKFDTALFEEYDSTKDWVENTKEIIRAKIDRGE